MALNLFYILADISASRKTIVLVSNRTGINRVVGRADPQVPGMKAATPGSASAMLPGILAGAHKEERIFNLIMI